MTAHRLCGPDLGVLRVRPHETFRYRAGQYTALESARLPHTWRPYYLAGEPGRDGELDFHVRCTGPGGVSEALVRHTAVGDRIRRGPPKENLALGEEPTGELRLVAWDTGWAAMKALLQELEGRLRPASEHRALSDVYDTEYLSEAERSRPWLTVVPVTGGTPGEGVYDRLARAVTRSRPAVAGRAMLAGPPAMVQTVTAALTRAGLPADHVRHDRCRPARVTGPDQSGTSARPEPGCSRSSRSRRDRPPRRTPPPSGGDRELT